MNRIKAGYRDQGILFSEYYLGDRLPDKHEVYLFKALVDKLDLSDLMDSYSSEGGSMFSPVDMVAVFLYAYAKGITSSYKIAELTQTSLPFMYLANGHVIKRRTLCDFRKRNIQQIEKLFSQTVEFAFKADLIMV